MGAMLPPQHYPVETRQRTASQHGLSLPVKDRAMAEQPAVFIRGDIRLTVVESQATSGPIIGCYSVETAGMQELLYTCWQAEGQVHNRHALSTTVAFDVCGARAGETRTYLVAVQVVESGEQGRAVQCGVFVQIHVSEDQASKVA